MLHFHGARYALVFLKSKLSKACSPGIRRKGQSFLPYIHRRQMGKQCLLLNLTLPFLEPLELLDMLDLIVKRLKKTFFFFFFSDVWHLAGCSSNLRHFLLGACTWENDGTPSCAPKSSIARSTSIILPLEHLCNNEREAVAPEKCHKVFQQLFYLASFQLLILALSSLVLWFWRSLH